MPEPKILMLNYEFPPIGGGAGQAHLCLLKEYTDYDNLTIDVLTSAPKPSSIKEKFSENVTIYKVGIHKKNLHFWRKIEVIEWLQDFVTSNDIKKTTVVYAPYIYNIIPNVTRFRGGYRGGRYETNAAQRHTLAEAARKAAP